MSSWHKIQAVLSVEKEKQKISLCSPTPHFHLTEYELLTFSFVVPVIMAV